MPDKIPSPADFFGGATAKCLPCALPAEIRKLLDEGHGQIVRGVPLGELRLTRWLDSVHPGHGITRAQVKLHFEKGHHAKP